MTDPGVRAALHDLTKALQQSIADPKAHGPSPVNKWEYTYEDGKVTLMKAYNGTTLLFTLAFEYSGDDVTSITRNDA